MPSPHDPIHTTDPSPRPAQAGPQVREAYAAAKPHRAAPADTEIQGTIAVLAAAEAMDTMLSVAFGFVRAGRHVDLAGLEQQAARLCAAALGCPPATHHTLRAALIPLLPRLDALTTALTAAQTTD